MRIQTADAAYSDCWECHGTGKVHGLFEGARKCKRCAAEQRRRARESLRRVQPTPCQQQQAKAFREPSQHPSFYDPDYKQPNLDPYENAVQSEIEDRAEREMATNEAAFYDWVANNKGLDDLSQIISLLSRPRALTEAALLDAVERIRKDYVDYRSEHARDSGEWDEIAYELMQDDREARAK